MRLAARILLGREQQGRVAPNSKHTMNAVSAAQVSSLQSHNKPLFEIYCFI
jgi:hypothetical protein